MAAKPKRIRNTHDPVASTQALLAALERAVAELGKAAKASRAGERRKHLAFTLTFLQEAWTHVSYSNLSSQDRADVVQYIEDLSSLVIEFIVMDRKPTKAQIAEAIQGHDRLADFVESRRYAANPQQPVRPRPIRRAVEEAAPWPHRTKCRRCEGYLGEQDPGQVCEGCNLIERQSRGAR